jgi:Spy/CpxP family protein refolding chaperone
MLQVEVPMLLFLASAAFAALPTPSTSTSSTATGESRAQERLEQALDRVEATPAQRRAASDRLDSLLDEVTALRERGQALREEVHDALLGARVDRAALEAARVELVTLFDDGSTMLFDFAADLSELFTPAQREELHELRHERLRDRAAAWWGAAGE